MGRPIAVYTPGLSIGGIGKMRVHLMQEMARRGHSVDLIVADLSSPLLKKLPKTVSIFPIKTTHHIWSIPSLARYLLLRRPQGIITDRLRLNSGMYVASRLTGIGPKMVLSFHNPISIKLASLPKKKLQKFLVRLRHSFDRNHKIVAVSKGVAQDLIQCVGAPREKIEVIHNPVVVPEMESMASEPVDHPFYKEEAIPVIITAARMTEQKDFRTLLHAFKEVRIERPCRLVILGQKGKYYQAIKDLVHTLGLDEHVAFLGFQLNPYKFISKSRLFVLSSKWEGFGNVLVEALALGTPVVATDCPVGPREILEGGKYGRLVPVGNVEEMKEAIQKSLDSSMDKAFLREAVEKYRVEESADGYLRALEII